MKLKLLRRKIDKIDETILDLLSRRLSLVKKASQLKKQKSLPVEDKNREKQILERLKQKSLQLDLPFGFISKIFREIMRESKRVQKYE